MMKTDSMLSESFEQIVQFRRSNRSFDPDVEVPDDLIIRSLRRSILSPNSSNLQLWEFHWIKSAEKIREFIPLCLNQKAASTAKQMVVFVCRADKWKERAKWNYDRFSERVAGEKDEVRKGGMKYYGKLIPLIYTNDPFGLFAMVRSIISTIIGLQRPFFRTGGKAKQRIMVHKSCALAAQTFMLSVAAEGFHTCPMEGFDEVRVRRAINLPRGAEINMIISVGKGTPEGVWGPRVRVPEEEVIVKH
jgi:nitroreductase